MLEPSNDVGRKGGGGAGVVAGGRGGGWAWGRVGVGAWGRVGVGAWGRVGVGAGGADSKKFRRPEVNNTYTTKRTQTVLFRPFSLFPRD